MVGLKGDYDNRGIVSTSPRSSAFFKRTHMSTVASRLYTRKMEYTEQVRGMKIFVPAAEREHRRYRNGASGLYAEGSLEILSDSI